MTEKTSSKGEMRRRWRAFMEDGSVAGLRSEGRLVALYVFYAANWSTCEVRFSMRKVAEFLGVQPTSVRRGVSQMVDAGILEVLGTPGGGRATRYSVSDCARVVRRVDTSGAQDCARAVRGVDTSGAQGAHEPCAARARVVRSPRTLCARNSVLISGSSVTTTDTSSLARPDGGTEPATAVPPSPSEDESSAAGLTGSSQQRQEDVA